MHSEIQGVATACQITELQKLLIVYKFYLIIKFLVIFKFTFCFGITKTRQVPKGILLREFSFFLYATKLNKNVNVAFKAKL